MPTTIIGDNPTHAPAVEHAPAIPWNRHRRAARTAARRRANRTERRTTRATLRHHHQ